MVFTDMLWAIFQQHHLHLIRKKHALPKTKTSQQHSAKDADYGSSTIRIFDLQIYQEGLGFFFRGMQRLVKDWKAAEMSISYSTWKGLAAFLSFITQHDVRSKQTRVWQEKALREFRSEARPAECQFDERRASRTEEYGRSLFIPCELCLLHPTLYLSALCLCIFNI
jgi:hypothetical protein